MRWHYMCSFYRLSPPIICLGIEQEDVVSDVMIASPIYLLFPPPSPPPPLLFLFPSSPFPLSSPLFPFLPSSSLLLLPSPIPSLSLPSLLLPPPPSLSYPLPPALSNPSFPPFPPSSSLLLPPPFFTSPPPLSPALSFSACSSLSPLPLLPLPPFPPLFLSLLSLTPSNTQGVGYQTSLNRQSGRPVAWGFWLANTYVGILQTPLNAALISHQP